MAAWYLWTVEREPSLERKFLSSEGRAMSFPRVFAAVLLVMAVALGGCLVGAGGPGGAAPQAAVAPPADCAYKWVGTWRWALGTTDILPNGVAYPRCFLCVPYQTWTCSGDTSTWSNPDGYTWTMTLVPAGDRMVGTGSNRHVTATRIGGPGRRVVSTIPGEQGIPTDAAAPTRPSTACPSGFQWVGGHLCAAYNVSSSWCASNGGRFIDPKIAGAPTRCEVDSARAAAAANRAPQAGGGDPRPTVIAVVPSAPSPSVQTTPPALPEPPVRATIPALPAPTVASVAAGAPRLKYVESCGPDPVPLDVVACWQFNVRVAQRVAPAASEPGRTVSKKELLRRLLKARQAEREAARVRALAAERARAAPVEVEIEAPVEAATAEEPKLYGFWDHTMTEAVCRSAQVTGEWRVPEGRTLPSCRRISEVPRADTDVQFALSGSETDFQVRELVLEMERFQQKPGR